MLCHPSKQQSAPQGHQREIELDLFSNVMDSTNRKISNRVLKIGARADFVQVEDFSFHQWLRQQQKGALSSAEYE